MKTLKNLNIETENVHEMKGLMEVYEELAAIKMQKIRQDILHARDFYDGLTKVSVEVGNDFSDVTSQKEKDTAVLFISANSGLYGSIIQETFTLFTEYIKKNKADVFIIGKIGKDLISQYNIKTPYQTIDFPDDKLEEHDFQSLVKYITPYKKIVLFYGRFRNIAIQIPTLSEISGAVLPQADVPSDVLKKKRLQFLYEPTISDVTTLFATEIRASILEQLLGESQLAKFASRLIHLDETIEHIDEHLIELMLQKLQLKKKTLDKKQNALVSGIIARGMQ